MTQPVIYIIGSLRNSEIPRIANDIEKEGYEVFADWHAAGEKADDEWQNYETIRGRSYAEALDGYAAKHVFSFDYRHLSRSDAVVLCLPAGKSGHLEFGWAIGRGKKGFVLFDRVPDRWDCMYQFATHCCFSFPELKSQLKEHLGGARTTYSDSPQQTVFCGPIGRESEAKQTPSGYCEIRRPSYEDVTRGLQLARVINHIG